MAQHRTTFFRKPEISAACTGINVDLIQRCGNILLTMASGHTINIDYFEEYCLITAKMFESLYPWYYMPASVYKKFYYMVQTLYDFLHFQ